MTGIVTRHLEGHLSGTPQRASVTFLGVEPIDVLRYADGAPDGPGEVVYATVGCARHPMTDPNDLHADPVRGPRAELVVRMFADRPLPGLHRRMATLAAAPAVEGLILAADALVDLGEPLWDGSVCTAALLEADAIGEVELPEPMEAVQFLRAIPITANEAAWVRLKGADQLRDAWREADIDTRQAGRTIASM
nr:suppressor of fused domain protein [Gordonia soli]